MSWEARYVPPNANIWQGRTDTPSDSSFYQHVRMLDLLSEKPQKTAPITFALIGFKCDEGAQRDLGRPGASEGPPAIRYQLAKLPIQKPNIHCYDVGNIVCTDHDLEASQQAFADVIALLYEQNICPIALGGGHEIAFAHYLGINHVYPPQRKLGMINFDPHFDLHPLHTNFRPSASTAFYQIAETHKTEKRQFDYNCIGIQPAGNIRQAFDTAKQLQTHVILADEIHLGQQEKSFDFVDRVIDENEMLYISLSMDVFSPAFAPGVSAINPLGLSPWHIIPLLRQAAASGKVIGYDIAELVPMHDIDHRTAALAAAFIYEIIHHQNEFIS
jgi:formiminoglutamase